MAGALSVAMKNRLLSGGDFATGAVFLSGHTADPGSSGSSEITGGSPVYGRKAITWNSPAAGSITASNTPTLDIPAGVTITWLGLWSASTGGTYHGKIDITDQAFASQGTYPATPITVDLNATASA